MAVLSVVGCSQVRGSTTPKNAALVFYQAAAAGDVQRAQAVSAIPVTEADLTGLRKALFASEATLTVDQISVDSGAEQIQGDVPTRYVALYGYTVGGIKRYPSDAANSRYQVGVQKQGKVWIVVSWTIPPGL